MSLLDDSHIEMIEYPRNGHVLVRNVSRSPVELHSCKLLKCWTAFKTVEFLLTICTLTVMFRGGKFCVPEVMPEVCGYFELSWYASEHLLCMEGVCALQSKVPYSQLYLIMVGLATVLVTVGQSFYLYMARKKNKRNVQRDLQCAALLAIVWFTAAGVEFWYLGRWWPRMYAPTLIYPKANPPENWLVASILCVAVVVVYVAETFVIFWAPRMFYGQEIIQPSPVSPSVSSINSFQHNHYMLEGRKGKSCKVLHIFVHDQSA